MTGDGPQAMMHGINPRWCKRPWPILPKVFARFFQKALLAFAYLRPALRALVASPSIIWRQ